MTPKQPAITSQPRNREATRQRLIDAVGELLAETTGKEDSKLAYTAGLLHDIGKVVLDQYITGAYPMLYREFQDRQSEIIEVENSILGKDHTQIGALLANSWSLPDSLSDAIRFHHSPEESTDNRTLTTIVYVAIFPSVLAFIFWNRAVRDIGATRAGSFIHLMPVFSSILAIVFLGESIELFHLQGIGLVFGGIFLATYGGGRSG